ncbi:MAG TPA: histone-like nucleoid-structuring protein Lsr2 [Geodermatophilus sp.]|nr:histone-like nucleoid-structuring protein Lsr2 [Geodermatophilus sp.]
MADEPDEDASVPDASAEDGSEEGESDEAAGGLGEADSEQEAAPDQSAEPARRPKASAQAVKPAFNGVDTAAVRAWAAANGLTVSPRGRIKDEVLKAYRAAGN